MTLRSPFLLLTLLLHVLAVWGQGTGAARARLERGNPRPDTAYTHALIAVAEAVAPRQPDSALSWSGQALALCRRLDDKVGEARAHLVQGMAQLHRRAGDLPAAERALSLARADFEQLRNAAGTLQCILLEAAIAQRREQFLPALLLLDRADSLALADSACQHMRSTVLIQRAGLMESLQLGEAHVLPLLRQALAEAQQRDPEGWTLPVAHIAMAQAMLSKARPDSAQHHFSLAADQFEEMQAWQERMHALAQATRAALAARDSLGASRLATNAMRTFPRDTASLARVDVLCAQGAEQRSIAALDSSLRLLRRAVVMARPRRDPTALNAARLELAQTYLALRDYGAAIRLGDSAAALADTLRDLTLQAQAHGFLASTYTLVGDMRLANRHSTRRDAALDSLRSNRERLLRLSLDVMQAYKMVQRDREDRERAQQGAGGITLSARDKWIAIGIAGAAALLILVLLVILIVRGVRIRRLRVQVKEEEERTEAAYEELARLEHNSSRTNTNLEQLVDERTEALKRAVEGLIEANEELDTFIYRASHDLLGPLARLKGLVNVARTAEQQAEFVATVDLIAAVTTYMDRVLRKLILVRDVKFPGGGAKAVDIVEMIQQIEPALAELPGIGQPEIVITDWVQKPVTVDERNLRIVLENLLENACIFRKDVQLSPRIEVSIKKDGRNVLLEVSDLGIGIPDAIRDRVFEIFFRGSERSKGNGLGLYLVRRAVDGLGGRVQVESKEGAFTKFSIRFPDAG